MRLLFEIALTHIAGRGRQTLVSIAGVTLGVGFAIAMAALMQGSQKDFVGTLIDAMPHIQITDEQRDPPEQPASRAYDAVEWRGLRPREDPRGILNPTAAIAALEGWIPGAMAASLRLQGVARYGGTDRAVEILGITAAEEESVSTLADDITFGGLAELEASGFGAIIGDRLAGRLSVNMGDSLQLTASNGVSRRFKVVGLFHTGIVASDETRVYVRLKTAQVLAGRQNALNDIRIRLTDPDAAPIVAARAEELLGYKAVSWQEANESLLEAFQIRNIIMYTVVAAILVVAGFGIFNIVSIITHEKARDIAILKSLGFTEGDVRAIFLAEGAAMGGAGGVLGMVLGYGLTRLLGSIKFELVQATEVTHLPVTVNPLHYLIAAGLALAAASIAGFLPARKAARGNPVDIIRGAT
ncbi:MAG TPA: ABC transporter permease [Thermohalobaculum sp.]|nr:ABC transporter permease [Thermohalobaculum sp.]